jgi:transcriptional regulator with XRE-family HTH domain
MSAIAERLPGAAKSRALGSGLSPGRDQTSYRLRMSKRGAEEFGKYLANFIARSGRFPDATTFARAANVSPSAVSRWVNGRERPSPAALQKIAPHVGVTSQQLFAIAYPERATGTAPEPEVTDPRIAELAAMVAPDSPLSVEEREMLLVIVDRIIEPHRKQMRRRRSA